MGNYNAVGGLRLVKGEILTSLRRVRGRLEGYVEGGPDAEPSDFNEIVTLLGEVRGVLSAVQLAGAARLVEEMQALSRDLLGGSITDVGGASEALMLALIQLIDYLDRVDAGHQDDPNTLLPSINDLRACRGIRPLSKAELLVPASVLSETEMPSADVRSLLTEVAQTARPQFHMNLLKWFRGQSPKQGLAELGKLFSQIHGLITEGIVHDLFLAAETVVDALQDGSLAEDAKAKALIGRLDKIIKPLATDPQAWPEVPAQDLLFDLVASIAGTKAHSGRIAELIAYYGLGEEPAAAAARPFAMSADPGAIAVLVAEARKEIEPIKDTLDLFARGDRRELEPLLRLEPKLRNLAKILAVAGADDLVDRLHGCGNELEAMGQGEVPADDLRLTKLAEKLMSVEVALGDLGSADKSETEGEEVRALIASTLHEVRVDIAKAERALGELVDLRRDRAAVKEVPDLFRNLAGVLRVLTENEAAEIIDQVAKQIERRYLQSSRTPVAEELELLAEAVSGIDLYVAGVSQGEPYRDDLLAEALRAVEGLAKMPLAWPAQAEAPPVEAQPRVVTPDTGQSRVQVDSEFIEIFLEEARDAEHAVREQFARWRADEGDEEALLGLRRCFQTIKGSGRLVGAVGIGEFARAVEMLLNRVVDQTLSRTPELIAFLEEIVGVLPGLIESEASGQPLDVRPLVARADALSMPEAPEPASLAPESAQLIPWPEGARTPDRAAAAQSDLTEQDAAEVAALATMDSELLDIYRTEARGYLDLLRSFLRGVEQEGASPVPDESVVRALHTLTGSARMTAIESTAKVTSALERLFLFHKDRGSEPDAALLKLLERGIDALDQRLERLPGHGSELKALGQLAEQLRERVARLDAEPPPDETTTGFLEPLPELEELSTLAELENLSERRLVDEAMGREDLEILPKATDRETLAEELSVLELVAGAGAPGMPEAEGLTLDFGEDLARAEEVGLPPGALSLELVDELEALPLEEERPPEALTLELADEFALAEAESAPAAPSEAEVPPGATLVLVEEGPGEEEALAPESPPEAEASPGAILELVEEGLSEETVALEGAEEPLLPTEALTLASAEEGEVTGEPEIARAGETTEARETADLDLVHGPVEETAGEEALDLDFGLDLGRMEVAELAPTLAGEEATAEAMAPEEGDAQGQAAHAADLAPAFVEDLEVEPRGEVPVPTAAPGMGQEAVAAFGPEAPETLEWEVGEREIWDQGPQPEEAPAPGIGAEAEAFEVSEFPAESGAPELAVEAVPGGLEDTSALPGQPAPAWSESSAEIRGEAFAPEQVATAAAPPILVPTERPMPAAPGTDQVFTPEDPELVGLFLEDARELVDRLDQNMRDLQLAPTETAPLEEIQRSLHTLKGSARLSGLTPIADLSHAFESLLIAVVDGQAGLTDDTLDLAQQALDTLSDQIDAVEQRAVLRRADDLVQTLHLALEIGKAAPEPGTPQVAIIARPPEVPRAPADVKPAEAPAPAAPAEAAAVPLIRVRSDLIDRLVNSAGEISIYRARLEQQNGLMTFRLGELERTVERLRGQLRHLEMETEAQILHRYERDTDALAPHQDAFDPLELDRFSTLQQLSRSLAETVNDLVSLRTLLRDLQSDSETLLHQQSRISNELQDGLLRTRMVPFVQAVPRLHRVVRQTAQQLGKEARLEVFGAEVELDRSIQERIVAPLEHLLRNAVAHGVEVPEERLHRSKSATGVISLVLNREGNDVIITVADDGAGLDFAAIRRKAVARGLLAESAEIGEQELTGLILESGFSTAEKVSQIAGRGVGLDVVKTEIKQLSGTFALASQQGQGTSFTIRLPLTLAIIEALLLQLGDQVYAIPHATVEAVSRIGRDDLMACYRGEDKDFSYAGRDYRVMYLGSMLRLAGIPDLAERRWLPVLLARSGDQGIAFHVDQLIGNQRIVVKPLGPELSSIGWLSGGTILADGRVAMIVDLLALIRSAAVHEYRPPLQPKEEEFKRRPCIMVVDDSLTVRRVTSRMLQRQNMDVITAQDGVDALTRLDERVPDVILLDIEMPRMDGYELTRHIRRSERLKNIPVIMITSRTGEKHRRHAMELGVNRYLGKPYQEADLLDEINSMLLEASA